MKKINKILKHFFIPHRGNAFRPHALRHKPLSFYSLALIASQFLLGVTFNAGQISPNLEKDLFNDSVIAFTNNERVKTKLEPLLENQNLNKAASQKLNDMVENDYWDHISPTGETAWNFIDESGYQYILAGENLAKGFSDSEDVVRAWMNSQSHKDNILNPKFSEIGVAVGQGKIKGSLTTIVVQLFGESQKNTGEQALISSKTPTVLGAQSFYNLSFYNAINPTKAPYFFMWLIILGLVIVDGIMIKKLGLHCSKNHAFNFKVSLLMAFIGLGILMFGVVSIA